MTTSTDKMRSYFEERQAAQKAERERQAQMAQQAKQAPLTTVMNFISAKNEDGKGMTDELKAFYKSATQADIESYIDAAEADNLHVIALTKDERFIHQKAAESYDAAMKMQLEITEARNQLATFRQKVKVTLFDGTPVSEVEKPATGGVGVKVPVTFEEAE
ncbi:hypothetical protein [Enterococcus asini]|uniref:hypothetical protein n=1 Tax=Enterococcus asini TaxID=57732 RepID=UPI00288D6F1E|nr:hypothetical protein [Enterococcus asini]MDT2743016.1 hypothetical protein [Enterococcus asini]